MNRLLKYAGMPCLFLLAGCVGEAPEGADVTRDKLIVSNNIDAARSGDAEAEYRVGDALCCSVDEGERFYDTREAVGWLCRAAGQGHGPAAYKLGEIYSGEVVTGIRVLRRLGRTRAGNGANRAVAYSWFRRAEVLGVDGAREAGSELWAALNADERRQAEALVLGHAPLPCAWDAVLGRS